MKKKKKRVEGILTLENWKIEKLKIYKFNAW